MTDGEANEVHPLRSNLAHLNNEDQHRASFPHQESLTSEEEDESNHAYDDNGQKPPPVISNFPPELLILIYQFTLLPESLLDLSLDSGFSVAWTVNQNMKLSILMVNKAWFQASVKFLYHRIVIRHATQLSLLCRTIGDFQGHRRYASLIRQLDLWCYVPTGFSDTFIRDIVYLGTRCSHVKWGFYPPVFDEPLLEAVANLPTPFTSIGLFAGLTYNLPFLMRLLRHSSANLTSLDLTVDSHIRILGSNFHPISGPLIFPNLETLRLQFLFVVTPPPPTIQTLTDVFVSMVAPKLAHARLSNRVPFPHRNIEWPLVEAFLRRHGGQLKSLQLFQPYPNRIPSMEVGRLTQALLDLCPNVQHLVLGPGFRVTGTIEFQHSSLQYVDLWDTLDLGSGHESSKMPLPLPFNWGLQEWAYPLQDSVDSDAGGRDVGQSRCPDVTIQPARSLSLLPELKNVRRIDSLLGYLPALPFVLPPSAYAMEDEKGLLLPIPGGPIQVSPCLLYHVEDDSGMENYVLFTHHPSQGDDESIFSEDGGGSDYSYRSGSDYTHSSLSEHSHSSTRDSRSCSSASEESL